MLKILLSILAFINGAFMLVDGLYVIFKGKYIGPEKPGPWANLFYKFNIDVFKLGPLFIIYGVLWLSWIYTLWFNQGFSYRMGLLISIITLWYLPVGTIASLIILSALIFARSKLL